MSLVRFRPGASYADLAHLVERHLAKVEVAGSSPVIRSMEVRCHIGLLFFDFTGFLLYCNHNMSLTAFSPNGIGQTISAIFFLFLKKSIDKQKGV